MNNHYYLYLTVTLIAATLPCVMGLLRLRSLDLPSKIFLSLMVVGLATEILAAIAAKNLGNNMPVYNISNLVQVILICLYYNYAIAVFRKFRIGWYLGVFSVLVGLLNIAFLQPLDKHNTYYGGFQMILVVLLTMALIQNELQAAIYTYRIRWSVHFWFSFLLTNLAILGVFNFSLYDFLVKKLGNDMDAVNGIMVGISALFNTAFATVFFLYPKMNRKYGTR